MAIKDNFYTRGVATTANSHIFRDFVPEWTATAVARLREEGGVMLGKTQMGPLATTRALTPDGDITTLNAWAPGDASVNPGGSSSGSATFRLLSKELGVSSFMGVSMAAAVVLIAYWRGGPEVAVVVGMTMTLVVVMGSLIGMSLPFLLVRLKLDPATSSAPLVTSIADISGVLIYFSLATWYLGVGG